MPPTSLPGTNAARHGPDGRLIAMNAADAAFRPSDSSTGGCGSRGTTE